MNLCVHVRVRTGSWVQRNASSFRNVIDDLNNYHPKSRSGYASGRRSSTRCLTNRRSNCADAEKHYAISLPISAPGCGDFTSAGKIFLPRGAGVLRSDCAASKTYPRWNGSARWRRCHSGVDSIRTSAKQFWTLSNACHTQTDFVVRQDAGMKVACGSRCPQRRHPATLVRR